MRIQHLVRLGIRGTLQMLSQLLYSLNSLGSLCSTVILIFSKCSLSGVSIALLRRYSRSPGLHAYDEGLRRSHWLSLQVDHLSTQCRAIKKICSRFLLKPFENIDLVEIKKKTHFCSTKTGLSCYCRIINCLKGYKLKMDAKSIFGKCLWTFI